MCEQTTMSIQEVSERNQSQKSLVALQHLDTHTINSHIMKFNVFIQYTNSITATLFAVLILSLLDDVKHCQTFVEYICQSDCSLPYVFAHQYLQ